MEARIHYLFAGISSVLSLFPTTPTFCHRAPILNDMEAQSDDWTQVGDDIKAAIAEHADQQNPA